jgi:hypothetical protein
LRETFENYVLSELQKKELIDDGTIQQILSQHHTGFSVWVGDPISDSESKKFIARYIERGPVSLEKLSITDGIVAYKTKDNKVHEFEPMEFLALLTSHLPSAYESITRYYGNYSCRTRGELAKKLRLSEKAKLGAAEDNLEPLPEPLPRPSLKWATCMRKMLEINPLECPRCKADMRIIAFIDDSKEISKIMKSLNIPVQNNPDKIPRAPPTDDFVQDMPNYDLVDPIYDD